MLNRTQKETGGTTLESSVTCPKNFVSYMVQKRGIDLPEIPDVCVVSHSQTILDMASKAYPRRTIDIGARRPVEIHFFGDPQKPAFAMTACPLGAPMAAVLLEELIALGFTSFIAVGIAGHPSTGAGPALVPGDLVLVDGALIYEGTSQHYSENQEVACPDPGLTSRLKEILSRKRFPFTLGQVATTDAFYRETEEFLEEIISRGVVAIDMELSALFTVSHFRKTSIASLIYISDIVQSGSDSWELAFAEENINSAEEQVFDVLVNLLEGA